MKFIDDASTCRTSTDPPNQGKYDGKSDKDFVKLKLCKDPTSSTSDLYEFNMSLFDNGEPEEFLLFVRNFDMTLAVSGPLETGAEIQYLFTLVCGEALHQIDLFSSDMESTNPLTVEYIIKGLELFKTKARNAPRNEETVRSKSKTLCGSFD